MELLLCSLLSLDSKLLLGGGGGGLAVNSGCGLNSFTYFFLRTILQLRPEGIEDPCTDQWVQDHLRAGD